MSKNSFKIRSVACADVETISDYIAKDDVLAAKKLVNRFNKTFEKISKFPNIGIERSDFRHKNVRFFVIDKHYLIVYRSDDNFVEILRVLMSYQDICKLL